MIVTSYIQCCYDNIVLQIASSLYSRAIILDVIPSAVVLCLVRRFKLKSPVVQTDTFLHSNYFQINLLGKILEHESVHIASYSIFEGYIYIPAVQRKGYFKVRTFLLSGHLSYVVLIKGYIFVAIT